MLGLPSQTHYENTGRQYAGVLVVSPALKAQGSKLKGQIGRTGALHTQKRDEVMQRSQDGVHYRPDHFQE